MLDVPLFLGRFYLPSHSLEFMEFSDIWRSARRYLWRKPDFGPRRNFGKLPMRILTKLPGCRAPYSVRNASFTDGKKKLATRIRRPFFFYHARSGENGYPGGAEYAVYQYTLA
jgi:hypothetical protein